ncbi:hypothetical protein AZI87_17355 [Bdellovibrio bacteriovorus]|uniref:Lipoprotein n=1 Tax=Bdellovibrio bacteriovorus TaxID=959 RepID=A0A162FU39_BDEBC|nr:hypothetical protein [Bdellovibrio bacteriovorus]KYG62296.1 hypothetical protein AZI87_17355 [Bdellovibrio bacteriovorus]
MSFLRPALLLIPLALFLSSCGELTSSISSIDSWIPESFYYKTLGNCEQGVSFPVLIGAGTQLWTDPSQVRVAQTELYLQKNKTYTARYREFDFHTQLFEKKIESTYALDHRNKEIHFHGLGVAKISYTERGRPFMHLVYSQNYNSTFLMGNNGDFYLYRGFQGLNESSADYCQ